MPEGGVFVWRNGRLVPKESAEPLTVSKRSDLPAPQIVRDHLSRTVVGQHDGHEYESRSSLLQSYRRKGVRVLESGEEQKRPSRPKPSKAEVAQALQKVKSGYKPQALPSVSDPF